MQKNKEAKTLQVLPLLQISYELLSLHFQELLNKHIDVLASKLQSVEEEKLVSSKTHCISFISFNFYKVKTLYIHLIVLSKNKTLKI